MGRSGSTTSRRARQMHRVLARWQRSGLTLREFGEQREIPLSTLNWWRQVFRRAGEEMNVASKGVPVSDAAVFIEVPRVARAPIVPPVLEIVLPREHVMRVTAGADADTLRRVLQALQRTC